MEAISLRVAGPGKKETLFPLKRRKNRAPTKRTTQAKRRMDHERTSVEI